MVGQKFAQKGFLVFGHDHIGHGYTTGERAQGVSNFPDDFCEPILAHCMARKKEEGRCVPTFLLGHSIGGFICVMTAFLCPPGTKNIKKPCFLFISFIYLSRIF